MLKIARSIKFIFITQYTIYIIRLPNILSVSYYNSDIALSNKSYLFTQFLLDVIIVCLHSLLDT
jgi:hypothetical protein